MTLPQTIITLSTIDAALWAWTIYDVLRWLRERRAVRLARRAHVRASVRAYYLRAEAAHRLDAEAAELRQAAEAAKSGRTRCRRLAELRRVQVVRLAFEMGRAVA